MVCVLLTGANPLGNLKQRFNPDYALENVMKLSNAIKTRVSG
jgi:hypothetical protein